MKQFNVTEVIKPESRPLIVIKGSCSSAVVRELLNDFSTVELTGEF